MWKIDCLLCARYTDPHVVRDATPGCPRYPIWHGYTLAPLNDANHHHDDRNDQEQMDESPGSAMSVTTSPQPSVQEKLLLGHQAGNDVSQ